jgi:tetratricopeptide (TPR) repeat protein
VFRDLKRYEEAVISYEKALEYNPNRQSVWFNLGVVLGKLKRYEEAIASYDRALELAPDDNNAWNNRGAALFNLGRYEEAIANYKKGLEIRQELGDQEGVANSLLALAASYQQCGRIQEGFAARNQAIQILTALNTPLEKMPYPKWLKLLAKFYEGGKLQKILCWAGGIILLPFASALLPFIVLAFSILALWRFLRFKIS